MVNSTASASTVRRLVPNQIRSSKHRAVSRLLSQSDLAFSSLCLGLDVTFWTGCFGLLHFLYGRVQEDVGGLQGSVFLAQFLVIAACLFIVGGYDRRTKFMSLGYMSEHFITLIAAGCLGGLFIYAGSTFGQSIHPSRGVLLLSQLAFALLSILTRRALGQRVQTQERHSYFLVLGAGERAQRFHEANIVSTNRQPLRFVDPALSGKRMDRSVQDGTNPDELSVETPTFDEFADLLEKSSGVVLATEDEQAPADLIDWLTRLHYEEVPVYTLETFYERHWRRVPIYAISPTWPLQMGTQLVNNSPYSHGKRLFDLLAAAVGLVLLAPLLGLLALAVLLESGRPVFFFQSRVGRDRRPFLLCKFRSMYVRAPGEEGSLYTGERDPRITRVGWYLRRLRLDELPQLWNVLKGDMSLIGPRAEWDRLVDSYERAIPCYHFRHLVKPGITGWAQVNYPYGASVEDAEQKLKYDLYYLRHYSLRLDAMIVLKTLHIMLWGKGQ